MLGTVCGSHLFPCLKSQAITLDVRALLVLELMILAGGRATWALFLRHHDSHLITLLLHCMVLQTGGSSTWALLYKIRYVISSVPTPSATQSAAGSATHSATRPLEVCLHPAAFPVIVDVMEAVVDAAVRSCDFAAVRFVLELSLGMYRQSPANPGRMVQSLGAAMAQSHLHGIGHFECAEHMLCAAYVQMWPSHLDPGDIVALLRLCTALCTAIHLSACMWFQVSSWVHATHGSRS